MTIIIVHFFLSQLPEGWEVNCKCICSHCLQTCLFLLITPSTVFAKRSCEHPFYKLHLLPPFPSCFPPLTNPISLSFFQIKKLAVGLCPAPNTLSMAGAWLRADSLMLCVWKKLLPPIKGEHSEVGFSCHHLECWGQQSAEEEGMEKESFKLTHHASDGHNLQRPTPSPWPSSDHLVPATLLWGWRRHPTPSSPPKTMHSVS